VSASFRSAGSLCIEGAMESLDLDELARGVVAIDGASRISLYGVSGSGWSAADLHRELFRIGRTAYCFADGHDALTSIALMEEGDVAIGFSHRGTTTEVVTFLAAARERGVTTVAVTNVGSSPVAKAADLVLQTTVREGRCRSRAMASRTAQLPLVGRVV